MPFTGDKDTFSDALLGAGEGHDHSHSLSSAGAARIATFRVEYVGGLPLRAGLELDSDVVYTVPRHALLDVGYSVALVANTARVYASCMCLYIYVCELLI